MPILEKLIKDQYYKAPHARGQRELDLEKVFLAIQPGLENEEPIYKACVNAGLPYVAVYNNYKLGKELAKKIEQNIEEKKELKNKSSYVFNFTDRESEQLDFYFSVELVKNTTLARAKKYLSYTLKEAEAEILAHERAGGQIPFEANPETLKLIKWLLERRERDRYATKAEIKGDGAFTFNVQFEDLPKANHDLTNAEDTPKKGDSTGTATQAKPADKKDL